MTETDYNPSNPDTWQMTWPDGMEHTGHFSAHQAILSWLRELGIDTRRLPADPHASLVDGQLTLLRKVDGPTGRDVFAPGDLDRVMTQTITVPVTVPPPPIVQLWLAPRCPTCDR